ncbi:MAG: hypothetical protein VCB80_09490, partial [Deltaproteobacteria bacterium]
MAGTPPSAEQTCRRALMRVSRSYLARNLRARQKCLAKVRRDNSSVAVDCIDGLGDADTEKAIGNIRERLDATILRKCRSVDLIDLNYPGPCGVLEIGRCHVPQCNDNNEECRLDEDGESDDCNSAATCIQRDTYAGCTSDDDCRDEAGFCRDTTDTCVGGPLDGLDCATDEECQSTATCVQTPRPFDFTSLSHCFENLLESKTQFLLDNEYPALPVSGSGSGNGGKKKSCVQRAATASSRMMLRELRTRQGCLEQQGRGTATGSVDWLCREDVVPYGLGTQNSRADSVIVNAYVRLLLLIPSVCSEDDLAAEDYSCYDPTGGTLDPYDLRQCLFDSHRSVNKDILRIAFPDMPVCGNGEVEEPLEVCDDPDRSNNDMCPNDPTAGGSCLEATCGDGFLCNAASCITGPTGGKEQCDNGTDNSDTAPDACRLDCSQAGCGDGVADSDEGCDDGNTDNTDACTNECLDAVCGDGWVQAGEACDGNGAGAGGETAECNSGCTLAVASAKADVGVTGTGIWNSITIDWDLSSVGKAEAAGLAEDADGNPVCAVSTELAAEGCLLSLGDYARGASLIATVNGCDIELSEDAPVVLFVCLTIADASGAGPGTEVTPAGAGCSTSDDNGCAGDVIFAQTEMSEPDSCGDGTVNYTRDEACDDGNLSDNDVCLTSCVAATCGDGFVCSGGACSTGDTGGPESCDDGNGEDADSCKTDCRWAVCGDGVTCLGETCETSAGLASEEECDDANADNTDDCTDSCAAAACGDGWVQLGEECDGDGTGTPGGNDECTPACLLRNECPGSGQLTLLAGTGVPCASDDDCLAHYGEGYPGTCDPELARCRTKTVLSTGQTGIAHGADITDNLSFKGKLNCEARTLPCGICTIEGILADNPPPGELGSRHCRCAADNRQLCNVPIGSDPDSCGAYEDDTCNCYLGPPLSFSAGNTPACVLSRIA